MSNEGGENLDPTNISEGTQGGIGPGETRNAMMGETQEDPNDTPGTRGRGFGGGGTEVGSPGRGSQEPLLHRGLAMALKKIIETTPSVMGTELKRQLELRDNYNDQASQTLINEYVGDIFTLRVFATMKEGSSRLRLLWGVGKFVDLERTGEVPKDNLAFASDRDTNGGTPTMVALPVQSSYKWPSVRGHFDDVEPYEAFYANGENKNELRPLPPTTGEGAGDTDRQVPRLLHLPGELGLFAALNKGKCTPFDLYQEAKRLADDLNCSEDMSTLELVLEWCIAASYKEAGKNDSAIVMKTKEASSDLQTFVEFKQKKCDMYLGAFHRQQVQLQQQPQQEQGMGDDRMISFAERIVASTAQAFAAQSTNNPQGQTTGTASSNPLTGGVMGEAEQAAVMGWIGTTQPTSIPKIWRDIRATTSTMTRRSLVQTGMQKWAKDIGHMQINKNILLPEQFFKDIGKADAAMDEASPSYALLDRGMSAQLCLPVTREFMAMEKARETADRETASTRTYTEALSKLNKDPRRPPVTLEGLKLAVATYAALLYVFFGPLCALYQQVLSYREAMEMPTVEHKLACYDAQLCREYWFQVLTSSREFFFTVMTNADIHSSNPVFPTSTLGLSIQSILNADNIRNGAFPTQWKTYITPQAGGGGGGGEARGGTQGLAAPRYNNNKNEGGGGYQRGQYPLPPPPGPPPHFGTNMNQGASTTMEHCHPTIKREFQDYHRRFDGQARLFQLCQQSNIAIRDLPWIREYIVNGKNTLCYGHLLGICRTQGCKRAHAPANTLPTDFVNEICRVTKSGREYLLRRAAESPGGTGRTRDSVSSGNKRQRR